MGVAGEQAASVAEHVAELEQVWLRLDAATLDRQAAGSLLELVQDLARQAPAAGYPKLAELASIIEIMLAPAAAGDEPLTGEFREIIRDYLRAVVRLSQSAPSTPVRPEQGVPEAVERAEQVLMLSGQPGLGHDLGYQVEHFGYRVTTLHRLEDLLRQVERVRPQAVVLDLPLHETELCVQAVTARLRECGGAGMPVVLLAEQGDLESRLLAVRAGADAYMIKPFDVHELVDQLDELTSARAEEPYQIVIVEDSPTQATYYSAILRKAGMVATVVSDPLLLLDVLSENAADLILMDMYMPRCQGTELAKVVRQFPRYASIPIVYLSAETELDRQLDALSLGGDDFLTKPIHPAHLIRSVAIRAERARTLRTFMLTDNLTGLLNHTRIKEQLHSEVARAARSGGRVTFAMLDIDHFKGVNDTYGHPVGDRVIKTLARVLQQRLRKSDYIGRYGGEEFAVILVDASAEEAFAILDQIRESFGEIRQFAAGGGFSTTFSGGIACFPFDADDAASLALRADKALYVAKRAGRNRICAHMSREG